MNDKEAFMDWLVTKLTDEDQEYVRKGEISPYFKPTYKNGKPDINEAWHAACEYKHKEIDDVLRQLKRCVFVYEKKVERILAENKKIRDALEFYADIRFWEKCNQTHYTNYNRDKEKLGLMWYGGRKAREALKDLGLV